MFSESLEELCRTHGWSLDALSVECGLAKGTLRALVRRGSEPTWETVRRVCHIVGVSPDWFDAREAPLPPVTLPVSNRYGGPTGRDWRVPSPNAFGAT